MHKKISFFTWFCWLSFFAVLWIQFLDILPDLPSGTFFLYWALGFTILEALGLLAEAGKALKEKKDD